MEGVAVLGPLTILLWIALWIFALVMLYRFVRAVEDHARAHHEIASALCQIAARDGPGRGSTPGI